MTAALQRSPQSPTVAIVAAEESGDALGAALAHALRKTDSRVHLLGVGGSAMAAAGIASPFAIDELAIIGLTAIPRRLPTILRRIRETADVVIKARPDALVIIDSPDFTHRVARRVRRRAPQIPILDYVSPSVWAWRPGRAHAMRGYIDHVLAILPFEPQAHRQLGGPSCTFVGHPLAERIADLRPGADDAARRLADPPVVLVLPGSRSGEVKQLADVFGAAIARLSERIGPIELVLPTVAHIERQVRDRVTGWAVPPKIIVEPAQKWAAFRRARAALAASGTVTLELALAGVPMVAAYRLHFIEAVVARAIRLQARLPSVILANLVIGENVVPELLQEDCTPEKLAAALGAVVGDTEQRRRQLAGFQRLDQIMKIGEASPSATAARLVLETARRDRAPVLIEAPSSG
jgi:lipid-A-disaccharide synthase